MLTTSMRPSSSSLRCSSGVTIFSFSIALSTLAAFSWSSILLAQEIQTRQFEATVRLALSVIVSIGTVVYWIVVFS